MHLTMSSLKIAFYCPNKPLSHPHPSGDLSIARNLHHALTAMGHDCREIVQFRSRWFWQSGGGWFKAAASVVKAYRRIQSFRPDLWLTYHSYYKSPDLVGPAVSRLSQIPYVLFQPMYSTRRRKTARTRLGFTLNRMALKTAAAVFTNNRNDLEALRRIVPSERITYLAPGINPEVFQPNEAARVRIRRQYGIAAEATVLMTAARFRPGVKVESLAYLFRALARLDGRELRFTCWLLVMARWHHWSGNRRKPLFPEKLFSPVAWRRATWPNTTLRRICLLFRGLVNPSGWSISKPRLAVCRW